MTRILDGKRIQYQLVDISQDNALRDEMRALAGNPKATPPQIVNGDQYCGVWALGWWECKLLQPVWRTVWRFLKKLEIELPYDPAIPLLGSRSVVSDSL